MDCSRFCETPVFLPNCAHDATGAPTDPLAQIELETLRSQQFAVFTEKVTDISVVTQRQNYRYGTVQRRRSEEKANVPLVITQRQMPLIRKTRLLRSQVQFFDDVVDPPAVSPDSCSRFGGPRDHEDLSGTVH